MRFISFLRIYLSFIFLRSWVVSSLSFSSYNNNNNNQCMVYASLCLVIFNNYYYLFMWYLQCCYVVCNITLGFFLKISLRLRVWVCDAMFACKQMFDESLWRTYEFNHIIKQNTVRAMSSHCNRMAGIFRWIFNSIRYMHLFFNNLLRLLLALSSLAQQFFFQIIFHVFVAQFSLAKLIRSYVIG